MTLIDGVNGPAAVAVAMWCGVNRPRSSGVDQRRRLQRTSAPSHNLVAAVPSIVRIAFGGTTVAIAGVIEGRLEISGRSDLSPSSNLTGQRSKTDERHFVGWDYQPDATSRSGERRTGRQGAKISERLVHNLGNPCAEKVLQRRPRQNNVSEPALVAGVGGHRQGTLTITGSNVRLGTEMPVALSSFSL